MIPAISGAVGPLGPSEWSISPVGQLGSGAQVSATPGTGTGTSGSFADALTGALNSLESTQASATSASQALATGQATDPTQAVTTVENASLSMDLAAQLRDKFDTAATTIFQTTV